jgi:hypothetical protein
MKATTSPKKNTHTHTKKMNEGVPFFASLMATTDKMGKKSLESVGKLEALESFKRKKTKDKMGRGSGRVVASLEGNGALKNKKLQFFSFIFDQK